MAKRRDELLAFGGHWAFLGGKIDKEDGPAGSEQAIEAAIKRELLEEIGYSFEELGQKYSIKQFKAIARAITPKFNPIRFESFCYLIELEKIPEIKDVIYTEMSEYHWFTQDEFFQRYDQGDFLCVPFTRLLMQDFHLWDKKDYYLDFKESETPHIPMVEMFADFSIYMPLSHTLPPADRTNACVIGKKMKIIIDPSPKDKNEYKLLLNELRTLRLQAIFLTHYHWDHYEMSAELARDLKLTVILSKTTYEKIVHYESADYFNDVKIQFVGDGDVICDWLGEEVIAYDISGHAPGHLGLAPKSLKWFFAGDLYQGIGTVVISSTDGDMSLYYESLKKVIQLKPKIIIPSHGIPTGGVHRLEFVLNHRQEREKEIFKLFNEGKSEHDILDILYANINPKLKPHALDNIRSHLKRI